MNDITSIVKDMRLLKQSRKLLDDLDKDRITYKDFLSECSYWGIKYLDFYRFKPMPNKPQEILEYLQRVRVNPNYEARGEFWRLPHISLYIQESVKIIGENLGNIGRLKEILNNLPLEDLQSRQMVKDILHGYKQWLLETNRLKEIIYEVEQEMEVLGEEETEEGTQS